MVIHLQNDLWGGYTCCNKKAPKEQVQTKEKLHLVTCLDCLRAHIFNLEERIDRIWEDAAGESL